MLRVVGEVLQGLAFLDVIEETEMPHADGLGLVMAIDYHGAQTGTVVVGLGHGLAESIAQNLLGGSEDEVDDDLVSSAAGELTNVVAGNLAPLIDPRGRELRLGSPRMSGFPPSGEAAACAAVSTTDGVVAVAIVNRQEANT